jgi:hypothetical protein
MPARKFLGLVPSGSAPVSRKRKAVALAIAGAADIVQIAVFPAFVEGAASPLDDALDAVTVVLLLIVLGFRWRLAMALAAELVPGVALFPSWTAVVLTVAVTEPAAAELPPAPARDALPTADPSQAG